MSRVVSNLISKWGSFVHVVPSEATVDEYGKHTLVYREDLSYGTKAIVWEAKGMTFEWEMVGIRPDIDFVFLMYPETQIKIGDKVVLGSETTFVDSVIRRFHGKKVQFLEILAKKGE